MALAAALVVIGSGARAVAATYDSPIWNLGYFDFPYVRLEQYQAYELIVSAPGEIFNASAALEWSGNRQAYLEDGSYDYINSQNVHLLTPLALVNNGDTLTASFVSTGDYDVYWPNGNVKYQFMSFDQADRHVSLYIRADIDPSLAGEHVTLTVTAVPEPATWALMISGFGLMGAALRRRPLHGPT